MVWRYIIFWAKNNPVPVAATDLGEISPVMRAISLICPEAGGGGLGVGDGDGDRDRDGEGDGDAFESATGTREGAGELGDGLGWTGGLCEEKLIPGCSS